MTAHMLSLRLVLCAVLLAPPVLAASVKAQDFSEQAVRKASPYKDLPGVEDPQDKQAEAGDPPECSKEVVFRNQRGRDGLISDDTGIVYRCEQNGIVVESTRPPIRRNWNPLAEQ